jgi:type IV pilus assembly protein PilV
MNTSPWPHHAATGSTRARLGRACKRQGAQSGATLIEVLVAVLLLSIGLLGMVGLQVRTMAYEKGATVRAAAANLVSDMSERIRANQGAGAAYVSNAGGDHATLSAASPSLPSPNCYSAACTIAELAAFDVAAWRISARSQLPAGVAVIESGGTGLYRITVAWTDKDFVDDAGTLGTTATCTATTTGVAARNCCPASLSIADNTGVRCARATVSE